MDMKLTPKGRKSFTSEEKLKIISECQRDGVKVTCAKYGIYPASYYNWKKKLTTNGEEGLEHGNIKKAKSRIQKLEKELEAMKLLFAEEQLKSRLKDELLKKKYPELRK